MCNQHPLAEGLSAHIRLLASNQVWLEGDAVAQLKAVGQRPDCVRAVGMPDLHSGPGMPIGAAFAFSQTIHPHLVGSDAGCGASLVVTSQTKVNSRLEARLEDQFSQSVEDEELLKRWLELSMTEGLARLGEQVDSDCLKYILGQTSYQIDGAANAEDYLNYAKDLGTVGGGNHFAEISQVKEVFHPQAEKMGLKKGRIVLLCHSGSRGFGKAVIDRWGTQVLSGQGAENYLNELEAAIRFAQLNRSLLSLRLLSALGIRRPSKLLSSYDVVHNTVRQEKSQWVHRKGCASAHKEEVTLVLGTRGTPSYVMLGKGEDNYLSSVAHGAGRKMQRSEAKAKLRLKYRRAALAQAKTGGKVLCKDKDLLYEEHPEAYKAIEPVIESIEAAEVATKVASLQPILTVKQ